MPTRTTVYMKNDENVMLDTLVKAGKCANVADYLRKKLHEDMLTLNADLIRKEIAKKKLEIAGLEEVLASLKRDA